MFRRRTKSTWSSIDQARFADLEQLVKQLAVQQPSTLVPQPTSMKFSPEAFQAYITEYEQCMESYRHTYETIWQAGAIFSAISAGIIAFTSNSGNGITGISPLVQVLAPIPVLFWFHGIYRPMNRYGELRNDRLTELEELLSDGVPGLQMSHYRNFSRFRKGESRMKRILTFKWLWRPRVSEIISIFGCIITGLEIYLLWVNYISGWFR